MSTTQEISMPRTLGLASPGTLVPAAVHPLSLRSNFAWAVSGNAVYAACQWGMIVALAKFGSSFMVGQFSLGLAVVTPVLMFSNLNLRAVQATDAHRQFGFSEYLRLRLVSTIAAAAVIAAIVWFAKYESRTAQVVLALAVAKSIEALSDIHYGLFQLNDRLDQTGRSMILRGMLSVGALSAGLYLTKRVFWGCVWIALAWTAVLLLYDMRNGWRLVECTEQLREKTALTFPRQAQLLSLALPMGIVTTIASVIFHMPRYFVHSFMGEHELGIFSAIAYATGTLTIVGDSLATSAVPRLARLYADGRVPEFRKLLYRLVALGFAIGLSGVAIASGAGAWFLTVFYSADYARQAHIFTILMGAAAVHFAASMLTSGITSARWFRIQVPLYIAVAGATAWGCAHWVRSLGLTGASLGVLCGAVVRVVLAAAVMAYVLWKDHREGAQA
jgi:O-antigen/teichoic acid export membrane protein